MFSGVTFKGIMLEFSSIIYLNPTWQQLRVFPRSAQARWKLSVCSVWGAILLLYYDPLKTISMELTFTDDVNKL